MKLKRVMTWELKTGRSHTEKRHHDIPLIFIRLLSLFPCVEYLYLPVLHPLPQNHV